MFVFLIPTVIFALSWKIINFVQKLRKWEGTLWTVYNPQLFRTRSYEVL